MESPVNRREASFTIPSDSGRDLINPRAQAMRTSLDPSRSIHLLSWTRYATVSDECSVNWVSQNGTRVFLFFQQSAKLERMKNEHTQPPRSQTPRAPTPPKEVRRTLARNRRKRRDAGVKGRRRYLHRLMNMLNQFRETSGARAQAKPAAKACYYCNCRACKTACGK